MSYEKLYESVYSSENRVRLLRAAGLISLFMTVTAYLFFLGVAFYIGVDMGIKFILITGIPFVLVSILRHIASAPRPYEIFPNFGKYGIRTRGGDSFPSRHVFSAFVIGVAGMLFSAVIGSIVLVLGVAIGACRVLLGIHFLRDVIAGALIGAASGLIGLWIFL